jgi:hypothetical protein
MATLYACDAPGCKATVADQIPASWSVWENTQWRQSHSKALRPQPRIFCPDCEPGQNTQQPVEAQPKVTLPKPVEADSTPIPKNKAGNSSAFMRRALATFIQQHLPGKTIPELREMITRQFGASPSNSLLTQMAKEAGVSSRFHGRRGHNPKRES